MATKMIQQHKDDLAPLAQALVDDLQAIRSGSYAALKTALGAALRDDLPGGQLPVAALRLTGFFARDSSGNALFDQVVARLRADGLVE